MSHLRLVKGGPDAEEAERLRRNARETFELLRTLVREMDVLEEMKRSRDGWRRLAFLWGVADVVTLVAWLFEKAWR